MPSDARPSLPDVPVLREVRQILEGRAPLGDPADLLSRIEAAGFLEQALTLVRPKGGATPSAAAREILLPALEAAVALARTRRMNQWQHDPRRRTLRLHLAVRGEACALGPAALLGGLARSLQEAGLPLAMGLEKAPRPALTLGHPLPRNVEGLSEWADAILREAAAERPEAIPAKVAPHLPPGLQLLDCAYVPGHASPVLELCHTAHWRWTCPPALEAGARQRLHAFLEAPAWQIRKTGKQEGRKAEKQVEVRHLMLSGAWEDDGFVFTTRLSPGEALNPLKLLAGVLEREPGELGALVRTRVDLAEDPRLADTERYAPKLSNIYEDAVLLESGGGLTLVDDGDDEPLVMN